MQLLKYTKFGNQNQKLSNELESESESEPKAGPAMAVILAGSADVVEDRAGRGEGTLAGARGGGVAGVGTGDEGAVRT